MNKSLEELRLMAQLAEQTQRYEDMAVFSKQIIRRSHEISEIDRKLFASAFKCKISERRTGWRAVSSLLIKQSTSINKPVIKLYKENLEKQIREICGEVIEALTQLLGKKSQKSIGEKDKEKDKTDFCNRLEFYKMKGDYLRYLCEIARDSEMKALKEDCEKAYKHAMKLIETSIFKDSLKTDALKLAICLNYSVFFYEICNSTAQAIQICEKTFNQALEAVSDLEDARFTDVVTIMQLMHDNLTSWKLQQQKSVK